MSQSISESLSERVCQLVSETGLLSVLRQINREISESTRTDRTTYIYVLQQWHIFAIYTRVLPQPARSDVLAYFVWRTLNSAAVLCQHSSKTSLTGALIQHQRAFNAHIPPTGRPRLHPSPNYTNRRLDMELSENKYN